MKKKIIFICDPGIGILDNCLSFLVKMNKAEYEIELLLLKNNFIRQFNSKDFITKTSNKIFSKIYFYINDNLYTSENLLKTIKITDNYNIFKSINLYINKFIFLIFKKRLLFLEKIFYYISFLIKNKQYRNFINKVDNENIIFDNVKFIIYDVHSEKSKAIKKIKDQIKDINKLSIFHGSDFPCLEEKKQENKTIFYTNKCNQIIFSNTDLEEYHYKYSYKFNNQFLRFGNPKLSSDWIKYVLDNAEKENFLNEKFVFLISRQPDKNYFSINKKMNYLKDIKKLIIDELNYKLVLRLHPKESEEFNNNLFSVIFGKKNYGKTWQISNLSPYLIGQHSQFALSFFSGLAVDLWFVGCPTIEYLSLKDLDMNKIRSENPKFFDEIFYKDNEYMRKIRFNDLVIGSSNENQLRKKISYVIQNKEQVVKKYKKLIEKKYFDREESVNKILKFIGNNCD